MTLSQVPFVPLNPVLPTDPAELLVRQTTYYNNIATNVNIREIAIYDLIDSITGQQWFTPGSQQKRSTFRKVFPFGAIAAGATLNIAHGIAVISTFTDIFGTIITAAPDFRPLPYTDTVAVTNQVSVKCTAANIVIVNGATAPNITSGIVVLEYLQN